MRFYIAIYLCDVFEKRTEQQKRAVRKWRLCVFNAKYYYFQNFKIDDSKYFILTPRIIKTIRKKHLIFGVCPNPMNIQTINIFLSASLSMLFKF